MRIVISIPSVEAFGYTHGAQAIGIIRPPTDNGNVRYGSEVAIGLEQYAALFIENEADLATLKVLTDEDLKEPGLSFGPRKRVPAALRAGNSSGSAELVASTPEGERC